MLPPWCCSASIVIGLVCALFGIIPAGSLSFQGGGGARRHSVAGGSRRSRAASATIPLTATTTSSTALFIMNWFGKSDEEQTTRGQAKKNASAASSSSSSEKETKGKGGGGGGGSGALIGGVSSVMESMDSFKRSQRIGKMTGALVQELSACTVEGMAENGKVRVTYDCQQRPVSTFVDEAFLQATDSADDVAEAITAAMKDAHAKSTDKMDEKMKGFFNDLGIVQ